jgi:hypothetical protein
MVERADVAPAYIANQTIVIELYGEYDVANIPQTGDINYLMQILSVFNGTIMESANATELNANWFYYYFNGIPAGFYYFYAYFTFNGINSPIMNISFIVHPPPVPYTAYWDGSTFIFHSDEYNLTGSYNYLRPFHDRSFIPVPVRPVRNYGSIHKRDQPDDSHAKSRPERTGQRH